MSMPYRPMTLTPSKASPRNERSFTGLFPAKGRCRVTQLPFEDVNKLLRQLGEHGLISRSFELARRINEKNEKYVRLSISAENAEMYLTGELKPPSEKAGRVIELLLQNPVVGASELSDYAACGPSVLKTLEKHGVIEFYSRRAERTSYIAGTERLPMPTLSHEQQKAFDEVSALMDSKKPKAALLYGVTGSGKTKVVLAAVKKGARQRTAGDSTRARNRACRADSGDIFIALRRQCCCHTFRAFGGREARCIPADSRRQGEYRSRNPQCRVRIHAAI